MRTPHLGIWSSDTRVALSGISHIGRGFLTPDYIHQNHHNFDGERDRETVYGRR